MIKYIIKRAYSAGCELPHRVLTGAFAGLRFHLDAGKSMLVILGLYEREVHTALARLSADIRCGIDVGAARGEYTLYLRRAAPAATILSFEPGVEHYNVFLKNVEANGFALDNGLTLIRKYVGQCNDAMETTLDEFAHQIVQPVFVKVDVEGAEEAVLLGACALLKLSSARFLIETHSAELEERCAGILARHGFVTQIIHNAWWRRFVGDRRPIAHNRWLIAFRATDVAWPAA